MKFRGLTMMDIIVGQLNFWILNYLYAIQLKGINILLES